MFLAFAAARVYLPASTYLYSSVLSSSFCRSREYIATDPEHFGSYEFWASRCVFGILALGYILDLVEVQVCVWVGSWYYDVSWICVK